MQPVLVSIADKVGFWPIDAVKKVVARRRFVTVARVPRFEDGASTRDQTESIERNRWWLVVCAFVNNLSGRVKKAFDTLVNGGYKPRHRSRRLDRQGGASTNPLLALHKERSGFVRCLTL